MKIKNKNFTKGFTLIEVLIAVLIFSALIAISSSLLVVGYVSGRTTSVTKNKINSDLVLIIKTMRQKLNNATAKTNFVGIVDEQDKTNAKYYNIKRL